MTDVPVLLARMQDRLHLESVDQATVVGWDIVAEWSTLHFQLAAVDGRWDFSDGVPVVSRLAIALDVDDLLTLAGGQEGAGELFLSGRLRLSGDLVLAQAILPGFGDLADQPVTAPRPDPTAP
jgi:SCP-2 sterol transfer family